MPGDGEVRGELEQGGGKYQFPHKLQGEVTALPSNACSRIARMHIIIQLDPAYWTGASTR